MLMSALVDPSAFDERHFQDKYYGSWARQFFKEMTTENGLFLADRNERLLVQGLRKRFHALSEKHRQQLLVYLAEAIKQKRFYFGDCSDADTLNICCELICQYNPDAVVTSPENINRFRNLGINGDPATVFSFHEYQDSNFQEARRRYVHEHQDLAKMTEQERKRIFFKITRFSSHLKIYDKQIGNTDTDARYGKSLDRFRKGIEYVLNQWGPIASKEQKGRLEIFTCARYLSKDDEFECKPKLLKKFLASIGKRRSNIQFSLFVKKDSRRSMHARYLQTSQSAIFSLDRGFDFYDSEKNFKLNPISLVTGTEIVKTLREFQSLEDCIEPLTYNN